MITSLQEADEALDRAEADPTSDESIRLVEEVRVFANERIMENSSRWDGSHQYRRLLSRTHRAAGSRLRGLLS